VGVGVQGKEDRGKRATRTGARADELSVTDQLCLPAQRRPTSGLRDVPLYAAVDVDLVRFCDEHRRRPRPDRWSSGYTTW
jgi:hypothetical protein